MNNAAAMRFVQRVRNLCTVFQYLLKRQRALFEALGERLAFHALHHQIVGSVLMTDVMQHADVRMIQAGDGFRFAFESLFANWIRGQLRGKNLDRNNAIKARVARAVNFAHPARA